MAEQKQEKKKPISVREILRWILCGLLGLLLIAAVTIRAPGKIVALLIVLLLACAALPRRARKWFGLSTAAAVIVLAAWVFVPDDDEGWQPYTFNEELAGLEAKYAIPDEENAALIYDKLFETMDGDPNELEFFLQSKPSSTNEPWLSKDHPETAEWLKGYQSTIEKLLQAAQKDKCRFPMRAEFVSYARHMEGLAKMRRCMFLLLSAANNDVAEGRTDAGLKKYLCITQIGHHLYQQQAMLDCLMGFAIENLALTRLNRFVVERGPAKAQLELIGNSIRGLANNWSGDWRKMLDFEKLHTKNSICSLFYEVNPKGKIRLSRGRLAVANEQYLQKISPKTYCQRKLAKAKTILGWLYFPSTPKRVGRIVDTCFEKYYAMAEPNFDWDKPPSESRPRRKINYRFLVESLTDILGQVYHRVHEIYLRNLSLRRGSRLLAAIKQYQMEHNAWPADLDVIRAAVPAEALIDPVTEKEFTYMNHGERFSLYGETANIWPR
jgi:hypothetical protein